ncbi:heat shock 70 kDa protein 12B-like [Saccostrea echinata]|uniref:heat shock 70 kDa protein 12B-like n=1 Tax=Saccostrea echinata TaxID=191078 RepID=UPI002A805390|nr:heat shock 70 kDa protein 12B-like [Saccostrea echinata]
MARKSLKDYSACVAIDIGTTGTGYAYKILGDLGSDRMEVTLNNKWTEESPGLLGIKTPTCLLLDPKMTFNAFGYEAENKYAELASEGLHSDWYYFERFKLQLFKNKITPSLQIEDAIGKKVSALLVVTETIKYIKSHAQQRLILQEPRIKDKEVQWVLTVPSIWDTEAKNLMKTAANKAGIPNSNLIIVNEADAASVFCIFAKAETGDKGLDSQPVGTKYMVIDIGGGTTDITVHERVSKIEIKEAYEPSRLSWGGVAIDEAFVKFITEMLGEDTMDRFRVQACDEFVKWIKEFERLKQNVPAVEKNTKGRFVIYIPERLNEIYKSLNDKTISELTKSGKFKHKGKIEMTDGKMQFEMDIIQDVFKTVTNKIVNHLDALFKIKELSSVAMLIFVGGTAESKLVQQTMFQKYQRSKRYVLYPKEPGTAVLKGAVILGHTVNIVDQRLIRHSYGSGIKVPFQKGIHPERLKIESAGGTWCRGVFKPFLMAGTPLKVGTLIRKEVEAINYEDSVFAVYKTDKRGVEYITDEACQEVCKVWMNNILPARSKKPQIYVVKCTLTETELVIELTLKETGSKYVITSKIEFEDIF